jgi:hypothetical protein
MGLEIIHIGVTGSAAVLAARQFGGGPGAFGTKFTCFQSHSYFLRQVKSRTHCPQVLTASLEFLRVFMAATVYPLFLEAGTLVGTDLFAIAKSQAPYKVTNWSRSFFISDGTVIFAS